MHHQVTTLKSYGITKRILSLLLCVIFLTGMLQALAVPADAAVKWPSFGGTKKPIRVYTLQSKSYPVYDSKHKKKKNRSLSATDEILITKFKSGGWVKIQYHYGKKTKTGYVPRNTFMSVSAPSRKDTAKASATVYRRSDGAAKTGTVGKGNTVYTLTSAGGMVQIMYSYTSSGKSAGWKVGWVSSAAYSAIINGSNASTLAINNPSRPTALTQGSYFICTGTVTSNYPIREVSVVIRDAKNNFVTGRTVYPNAKSFNIRSVDDYILFNTVRPGTNYYRITARDDKKTVTFNAPFTVRGAAAGSGSPGVVGSNASYFLGYAPYRGLNYKTQTSDKRRIAALNKAKNMATVMWKAAFSFPTWYNSDGKYSTTTATDGTSSKQFLKGKTYIGIPFSMVNHSYDDTAWANLVKNGYSYNSIAASYYSNKYKTTAKGSDCSYFVYLCMLAGGARVSYQTTYMMYNGKYYKKINMSSLKPGDILLARDHVRLYAGKVNGKYAVFESTGTGSKTRYALFTPKDLIGYGAYRYKGW